MEGLKALHERKLGSAVDDADSDSAPGSHDDESADCALTEGAESVLDDLPGTTFTADGEMVDTDGSSWTVITGRAEPTDMENMHDSEDSHLARPKWGRKPWGRCTTASIAQDRQRPLLGRRRWSQMDDVRGDAISESG